MSCHLPALRHSGALARRKIGAGTGYLPWRLAPAVVPGGRVWAVEVQPEMVSLLQAGAKRSGLTQSEVRLGAVDDVRLPAGSVDLAIMVDAHHELAYPYEVMASVVKALKPGLARSPGRNPSVRALPRSLSATGLVMSRRNSPHDIADLGELSRLSDFVFDKRQGQRASAKKHRRNRHYEKQFIRNTLTQRQRPDRPEAGEQCLRLLPDVDIR